MFELDGSETSWLVYADWLEDHDIESSHIREMANDYDFQVNDWCYTWEMNTVGVDGVVGMGGGVGGANKSTVGFTAVVGGKQVY